MDRRIGSVEAVALALVVGQLASWWQGVVAALIGAVTALLIRPFIHRRTGRHVEPVVVTLLAFALGSLLGAWSASVPTAPDRVNNLGLPWRGEVDAIVADGPWQTGGRQRLTVDVLATRRGPAWAPTHGRLALTAYGPVEGLVPGVRFRARLSIRAPRGFRNPGSFDWAGHLARRGIYATASLSAAAAITVVDPAAAGSRGRVARWRRRVARCIAVHASGDARAVLLALVVGHRGEILPELRARFVRAGVAHVLAISGLHVGLVAWMASRILRLLVVRSNMLTSRFGADAVANALAWWPAALYCALGGLGPSALRAGSALAIVVLASALDRRPDGLRVVALVAASLAVLEPGLARDVGFQLSLAAVVGLVIGGRARGGLVRRGFGASIGAWAATAPLLAYHFQEVSLAGPVLGPLLLPFFGLGPVAAGVLGAMLEPVSATLAGACVRVAGVLLSPGLRLVGLVAQLPAILVAVPRPSAAEVAGLYVALVVVASARIRRRRAVVGIVILAGLLDIGWWVQHRMRPGRLVATFLDVGQGDAAVVELPNGAVMVIDGGGFPGSEFDVGRAVVVPFLRARKLGRVDVVVVSHAHPDHFAGLVTVVEAYRPRELWWPGVGGEDDGWRRLETAARLAQTEVHVVAAGHQLPIGGAAVRILHPRELARGAINDSSVVVEIEWAGRRLLLTGDIEARAERSLVVGKGLKPAVVVKVPHHGSRTSSTAAFVRATSPAVAVVSAGAGNRYGHPAPEVVGRWQAAGACVLRTDTCGAVTVVVGPRGDVGVSAFEASCACRWERVRAKGRSPS